MTRGALGWAIVALVSCAEFGCAGTPQLAHVSIDAPKLQMAGYTATIGTLAVMPVADERASDERRGQQPQVSHFFSVGVYSQLDRRGNLVWGDSLLPPDSVAELRTAIMTAVRGAGVARKVVENEPAEWSLQVTLEHAFAAQHIATREHWVLMVPVWTTGSAQHECGGCGNGLVWGNVVLHAKLVENSQVAQVAWDDHIAGASAVDPATGGDESPRIALAQAIQTALQQLAARLSQVLAHRSEKAAAQADSEQSSQPPALFIIERASRDRLLLERVFVDTQARKVVRHEVVPAGDPAYARAGEWVVATTTPEGGEMTPRQYEAMAEVLAATYDLRRIDDARRYHFFGTRIAPERAVITGGSR